MLKPSKEIGRNRQRKQPPSGGCVLKPLIDGATFEIIGAATFGWLCVETIAESENYKAVRAATFGWLCVETSSRLFDDGHWTCSHLRVAVC